MLSFAKAAVAQQNEIVGFISELMAEYCIPLFAHYIELVLIISCGIKVILPYGAAGASETVPHSWFVKPWP